MEDLTTYDIVSLSETEVMIEKQKAFEKLISIQNYLHTISVEDQNCILKFIAQDPVILEKIGSNPSMEDFDHFVENVESSQEVTTIGVITICALLGVGFTALLDHLIGTSRWYTERVYKYAENVNYEKREWRMLDYQTFMKIANGLVSIKQSMLDACKRPGKFDPTKIEQSFKALGVNRDWSGMAGAAIGFFICGVILGTIGSITGAIIGVIARNACLLEFLSAYLGSQGVALGGVLIGDKYGGMLTSDKEGASQTLSEKGWNVSNLKQAAQLLLQLVDSCEAFKTQAVLVTDWGDKRSYFMDACKNFVKIVRFLQKSLVRLV